MTAIPSTPDQPDNCQRQSLSGTTGSADIPSAARIAILARRVARSARAHCIADIELKRAMEERYGEHDEMPDELVESINYGNGRLPTAREIDNGMTKAGYPPLDVLKNKTWAETTRRCQPAKPTERKP